MSKSASAAEEAAVAIRTTDMPAVSVGSAVELKDSTASVYANFCRVTGTPEEVLLDFGLNSQPFARPAVSEIRITSAPEVAQEEVDAFVSLLRKQVERLGGEFVNDPIRIDMRLVLNHYNTKRLLSALAKVIQRNESAFGVIETDVQQRASAPKNLGT